MKRDTQEIASQIACKAMDAALDSIQEDIKGLCLSEESNREGSVLMMTGLSMMVQRTLFSLRVMQAIHLKPEAIAESDQITMKIVKATMEDNASVRESVFKFELIQLVSALTKEGNES